MALRDLLTPSERDVLQFIMEKEPVPVRDVAAQQLIALGTLCHRGLVKYSKRGWVVNWKHIPRPS